jgi:peptidoglycan/LPS O-acetylase OafA/YrhL
MAMARPISDIVPYSTAVVAGVLAWDLVRLLGERREAWDDPDYWLVGYPLMLAAAFILGLGFPERPWRWALAIVGAQAAWATFLAIAADGVPNLFPLGLMTFGLLGLPCVAAAYAGGWVNQRLAR